MRKAQRDIRKIFVGKLFDGTPLTMDYERIDGLSVGPTLFVSAAVHGDELIGTEVIRRFRKRLRADKLKGTVILVPVVNVFGFIEQSRYLPDRRDLNRSFPGRPEGSLASQLAHAFMEEIVKPSSFGIDIHSAAVQRCNLPHTRSVLSHPMNRKIATALGVPLTLDSKFRPGSLRQAAHDCNVPVVVLEAGEALRFDEASVRMATEGLFRVLEEFEMIAPSPAKKRPKVEVYEAHSSLWVRAPASGLVQKRIRLGQRVRQGQLLARISDRLGVQVDEVHSPIEGVVMSELTVPLVTRGAAMFHIATFADPADAEGMVNDYEDWESGQYWGT